jgi:hypothetical protein
MNTEDLQKEILETFEIDERLLPVKTSQEEQFAAFRQLLIQRI